MFIRTDVKERGKKSFKANYANCFLVSVIHTLIAGSTVAVSSRRASSSREFTETINIDTTDEKTMALIITLLIALVSAVYLIFLIMTAVDIFLFNPLKIGCSRFFLLNHSFRPQLGELTYCFRNNYLNSVLATLLKNFLISIGFIIIVPGIILTYSYRMVPYILATNPTIRPVDALKKSREMMLGNKWRTFVYDLSFIGWYLLSLVTCGIVGLVYLKPYKMSSNAALFEAISGTSQNTY
ncbi:MAG: DUF975 family protein [Butyrivibrio sp.]|nr:DUF975 family protein [Butyrivibrio sp.]